LISLSESDHQLLGNISMKNNSKENSEGKHEKNTVLDSKSCTFRDASYDSYVKCQNSPSRSEGTISINSSDESCLSCENSLPKTENMVSKEICSSTNDYPISSKQYNTSYLTKSPQESFQVNSCPYPGGLVGPFSLKVTPCSQKIATKAHLTNFEILLVTPHINNSCYIQTLSCHQTSSQICKPIHKSSHYYDPETHTTDKIRSEVNTVPQSKKVSYVINDFKEHAPNSHFSDDDSICESASFGNASANEGVLNVKRSKNSWDSQKEESPTAMSMKMEENQKLVSSSSEC
jgi:hypothetical protein